MLLKTKIPIEYLKDIFGSSLNQSIPDYSIRETKR